jgi:hypothetical protein
MIVDRPDKRETVMANEPNNPFGIPGLGQPFGTPGNNPLLASLEMMRQAMSTMSHPAGGKTDAFATPLTTEDLSRRISELKVVENWLKLNLSMLTSSIQGLEVQLATIQTLKSFAAMGGMSAGKPEQAPSPLDLVLGLRSGASKDRVPAQNEATTQACEQTSEQTSTAIGSSPSTDPADNASMTGQEQGPAQAWWKMLENQFTQIAAATVAATKAQAAAATKPAQATKTTRAKKTAQTPSKRPAKRARKKPNLRSD